MLAVSGRASLSARSSLLCLRRVLSALGVSPQGSTYSRLWIEQGFVENPY